MARNRIIEVPALKTWEDVNSALREIAEEQIILSDIESDMNKQIIGVKKSSEITSKTHLDRIEKLSKDIKEYAQEHREELGKKKTYTLNYGEIGFRQSTTISLPKAKDKLSEIIKKLRNHKMLDCIAVKETINKDALRQYGEDKVIAVGAGWKQKDVFWYEAAREKLEKLQAANL